MTLSEIINELKAIEYWTYLNEHPLHTLPYINLNEPKLEFNKNKKWETVDPKNSVPSPPEFDDLIRLHYLILRRRARVILEFGVGKSTSVMLDAISKNKEKYANVVDRDLRISDAFKIYSVDNSKEWYDKVTENFKANPHFNGHFSNCSMSEFNGRICTYYDSIPNIRPDFIYLDGPSQFGVLGSVRGVSTEHKDRMPMAADILAIEHFLEPGTFIVVDGRTANARFLNSNFQRNWDYVFVPEFDQHYFLMNEEPLGKWNNNALKFINN